VALVRTILQTVAANQHFVWNAIELQRFAMQFARLVFCGSARGNTLVATTPRYAVFALIA